MSKKDELIEKELAFRQNLRSLDSAPVKKVNDFQQRVVKELPVERINTVAPQKIKSGSEFLADKIIHDSKKEALAKTAESINYNDIRKEFLEKSKTAARAARFGGKKLLGALPLVGGLANALISEDASAAAPMLGDAEPVGPAKGSFDDRLESGALTEDDKQQLLEQQARIRALQNLGK